LFVKIDNSLYIINQHPSMNGKFYKIDDFVLDMQRRCLFYENHPVQLSSRAFDILSYLIERKGEIVEKEELLQRVWTDSFVEEGNLAVHISAIRRILLEKKGESTYIRTISGRGYSFIAPVAEVESLTEVATISGNRSRPGFENQEKHLSLAVLPFTFEESKKDNEYLADGITRSLINDLSQLPNLKVLAHSAVKKYKNSELELQEIGFLLDANKILTGHISKYEGKLEIVAELINASDKRCIWGSTQFFELDDIFKVKNEIALSIAGKLKRQLSIARESKVLDQKEVNVEAQKLYFRGKFILESRTTKKQPEEVLHQALKFFKEAVKKDPNYALAYVGIGSVYVSLHNHNLLEREKAYSEATKALQMALHITDKLSEIYVLKGSIEIMFETNFAKADKSLDKAIKLNSNNPDAYHWKSYICICFGKFDEAVGLENKAAELDPTSIYFNEMLTRIFFYSGNYNETIVQAEELLEFDESTVTSYFFMALSYAKLGFFDLALLNIEKVIALRDSPETLLNKAFIYGLSGNKAKAKDILKNVLGQSSRQIDYADVASVFAVLGDSENVFAYLNRAFDEGKTNLNFIKVDVRFENLYSNERFKELLVKLKLT
jgi:adenylate cyclase